MPLRKLTLASLCLCFALGCDNGTESKPGGEAEGKPKAPKITTVTLKKVDQKGLDKAIAEYKGMVVVVDFWATFCPPCLKEFPNFVKMSNKYADKGLVGISATWDDPDNHEVALGVLKKEESKLPNFLVTDPDKSGEKYDFEALPAAAIYGKDGKLVKVFKSEEGPYNYEDVEKFVKPLLEGE